MKVRPFFLCCVIFSAVLIAFSGCATGGKPGPAEDKTEASAAKLEEKRPVEKEKTEEEIIRETYEEIEEQMEKGEAEKALELFEKSPVPLNEPGDMLLHGLLLFSAGQVDKAHDVMEKASEKSPEDTEILFNLSVLEGYRGDGKKQQELLEKIIGMEPAHVEAQTALGTIYLDKKKRTEAKEAFQNALKQDETYLPARMGYAQALIDEGNYENARKELDRVVEQDPEYSFAFVDRSRTKIALEDRKGAVEDLTRAIELDPGYFWNYLDRGRLYLMLGETNEAAADFSKAIELDNSNFFPFAYRGGIYEQTGRNDEAIADFERAVELREDYYFAYASLGTLYYMKEEWENAGENFLKAYAYQKEITTYAFLAAVCLKRAGLEKEAREYLQEVIQKMPRDRIDYHIGRLFADKNYDAVFLFELDKEKDERKKSEAVLFYGLYYLLREQTRLAHTYLLEAEDKLPPTDIAARIAAWELNKLR